MSFPGSVQVKPVPAQAGKDPSKSFPPLDLAWRRCLPGGCFADATVTEDVFKRWRTTFGPG